MGPVSNGEFETPLIPQEAPDTLEGTPADRCIGVGHQAFYGDATWQHKLLDEEDPEAAAEQIAAAPADEALFLSGVDHCVASDQDGDDFGWIGPVSALRKPAGWSHGLPPAVEFPYDGDDDLLDREVKVLQCQDDWECSEHTMWQSYASRHQAWSARFDTFEFRLEDGSIGNRAKIEISVSETPLQDAVAFPVLGIDCTMGIRFSTAGLAGDYTPGTTLSFTPLDLTGFRGSGCQPIKDAHASDDLQAMQEAMGRFRLIQVSFWAWNDAPLDDSCQCAAVIDGVEITGSTLFVEEAAAGNVNVNPGIP